MTRWKHQLSFQQQKLQNNMGLNNANRINEAENLVNSFSNVTVKRVKRDNGLIERKNLDDNMIILEDNRQVIFG